VLHVRAFKFLVYLQSFSQPAKGGAVMNAMYALGAVLSLGLLVYLMIALLKAEWF